MTKNQARRGGSRKDPVRAETESTIAFGTLLVRGHPSRQDPEYDYHLWDEHDEYCGLTSALEQGWEVIEANPDDPMAPRFRGGCTAKKGEPLRSRGMVATRRRKDSEDALLERQQSQTFRDTLHGRLKGRPLRENMAERSMPEDDRYVSNGDVELSQSVETDPYAQPFQE